jgi:hypothetical protein
MSEALALIFNRKKERKRGEGEREGGNVEEGREERKDGRKEEGKGR